MSSNACRINAAERSRVVGLHHSSGVRNGKRLDIDACIVFELRMAA
jgi:hypothetical protein